MRLPKKAGLTLAEMVLALAITTMVGLSVAGVSTVLSTAYADGESYQSCIQTARSAMRQVRRAVQGAQLITAVREDKRELIYWAGDANGSGTINLAELRIIKQKLDNTVEEYRVVFPDDWSDTMCQASDVEFSLSAAMTVANMENQIVNHTYVEARTIATDIATLTFSVPTAAAPLARLVRIGLTACEGRRALTLKGAAALRADLTRYVDTDAEGHVLVMPPAAS